MDKEEVEGGDCSCSAVQEPRQKRQMAGWLAFSISSFVWFPQEGKERKTETETEKLATVADI